MASQTQPDRTIHYTKLPASQGDKPGDVEYETYRREVGRLLAEGHEGKFALIKNDQVVGLYESFDAANVEGRKRWLWEAFCVKQLLTWEPILRIQGYDAPWRP
jgi:hypothetical protein